MPLRNLVLSFLFLSLAACAVERVSLPPVSGNSAVLALLDDAKAKSVSGQLPAAEADLERALRIEPRNARLWQELARLHLTAGDNRQAEGFAARANTWSGGDRALEAENWRIIGEARSNLGDEAGAQAARDRARNLAE